jgi:predicted flap endonuclease-1-like 5' DNA nuclease
LPKRPERKSQDMLPSAIGQPAMRALASIGVTRLGQVTRFTEDELLAVHGIGPKAIRAIKSALSQDGRNLANGN